jgi:hypothetical protein
MSPLIFSVIDGCLSVSLSIYVQEILNYKELRTPLFSQLLEEGRPLAVPKDDSTKDVAVSDCESSLI